MSNDRPGRGPSKRGVDYRVLAPLLLHTAAAQMVVSVARITTSYRVVELDLPVVWLGVIAAVFALLPVFLAVWVGRFIDRGHDALASWIGSGLMIVGAAGLFVSFSSKAMMLASTALLGTGHLFLMASQQMLCVRCSGRESRESVFGNYMVAGSVGQALGPYVVGWAGGSATVPPTQSLFFIALLSAFVTLAFSVAIRPSGDVRRAGDEEPVAPVGELLRTPGLPAVLMASVITVTAQDIILIYLPLLGAERRIDAGDIGVLLTIRAAAALVSRLLYARLVLGFGRNRLMVASLLVGGLGFGCLAAPIPLAAMNVATAVLGLATGVATTITITSVLELTKPSARGTANSLRIMGNRIGQVALPFGASLVAAATGSAGILAIIAAGLIASGAAVFWSRPGR